MSTLGERLRKARDKKGYSQTEVYRRISINNKTLSKYENDDTKPDIETLNVLADFYECNIEWLVKGEGPFSKSSSTVEDIDPEVRTLARDIQKLESGDKELLKGLIKSMTQRGKKAIDE